jgi:hypothetical protein
MAPGDLKGAVDALLAGEWGVVDGADGFLLLRRGASTKTIPEAFYDFARIEPTADVAQPAAPPAKTELVRATATQWLRWRATKVTAEWLVGADQQEQTNPPRLELVTPDGELLYDLTTAAPPALVWYPPARWQPGERVRVTTLPLYLPRFWGIVSGGAVASDALIAVPHADGQQVLVRALRQEHAGLREIPVPAGSPPFATAERLNPAPVTFGDSSGRALLTVESWGASSTMDAGGTFLLWLRWRGTDWPAGKTVFVHLRAGGQIMAQHDGSPRFFVPYDPDLILAQRGTIDDVRPLHIPTDLQPGTMLTLVVGLYEPTSGTRLPLVDQAGAPLGEEWVIGQLPVVAPPVPDQACAMIPATCGAQVVDRAGRLFPISAAELRSFR